MFLVQDLFSRSGDVPPSETFSIPCTSNSDTRQIRRRAKVGYAFRYVVCDVLQMLGTQQLRSQVAEEIQAMKV